MQNGKEVKNCCWLSIRKPNITTIGKWTRRACALFLNIVKEVAVFNLPYFNRITKKSAILILLIPIMLFQIKFIR